MRLVYLVGQPGVGKTTALSRAIELVGWSAIEERDRPVPHVAYDSGAIQLGRVRPPFGGTDALSMSIGPQAAAWMASAPAELVVAEGDRLAYDGFLTAAASAGTVELIWLDVAPDTARARALARSGQVQNLTWVKGRIRKVDNLVARRRHTRIDASAPVEEVARQVAAFLGLP